jgi:nucleotide-binding universal stress UspA family protein
MPDAGDTVGMARVVAGSRLARAMQTRRQTPGGTVRILAALDLNNQPEFVLQTARKFAIATGGTLDLVFASAELARVPMDQDDRWTHQRAAERTALEALRDSLPETIRGTSMVLVGAPAEVLPPITWDYDLVVLATHGRSGLRRWVVGSVAEAVLRTAHCPVLTVRLPSLE